MGRSSVVVFAILLLLGLVALAYAVGYVAGRVIL